MQSALPLKLQHLKASRSMPGQASARHPAPKGPQSLETLTTALHRPLTAGTIGSAVTLSPEAKQPGLQTATQPAHTSRCLPATPLL